MSMNYTREECYEVANTIWQQLGSQRFALSTKCKALCYGEKDGKVYLLVGVPANKNGISLFEIAYNEGHDLYEVRFMRKNGGVTNIVANYSGVYCDMLHTLFTQHTGIEVKLKMAA